MFETPKTVLPLKSIMQLLYQIGARIGLQPDQLAELGSPPWEGRYVLSDRTYCYVTMERGSERERRRTADLDELLYWVFEDVTSGLAVKYELQHRNEKEEFPTSSVRSPA